MQEQIKVNPILLGEDFKHCTNSLTFNEIRHYRSDYFREIFIDSLFNTACVNTDIKAVKSDESGIYIPIDAEKTNCAFGITDSYECLYEYIVLPMFDRLHRKNNDEIKFLDPDYDYEWTVYIKFNPIEYHNHSLNCFNFAVEIDGEFYCNIPEETDLMIMEEFDYPCMEYVKQQYNNFAKFAELQTKEYIREKLFRDVAGNYISSAILGDMFVQLVEQKGRQRNFVVNNYLNKIIQMNGEKIPLWNNIYSNLTVM